MISVRPERDGDAAAIRDIVTAAFHDAHVADLVDTLRAGPLRASLVAEVDGQLVGHVMLSRGWVDAEQRLVPDALILSPLAVAPEFHGRGIGATLVRAAIDEAAALTAPLLFLEGSPTYYARFGFAPAVPLGFRAPSVRIPEPAFQVVTLPSFQPWMTGALVYPDAFWAHDSVGLRP